MNALLAKTAHILAAVVCLASSASSIDAETWIVGSMEGFAPFNYSVGGEYRGIDVEILNEAADKLNIELEHRPLPWNRALLDFSAGNLDAIFQLAPTSERFEKWNMVGPMRRTKTVYVTLAESPIVDIRSLADLDGLIVGVVSGFTYENAFDRSPDIVREMSKDDYTNILKLMLGRSDVIVGGHATLTHVIDEMGLNEKLRFLPTPLVEQGRYIAFPRNRAGDEMAGLLQKALNDMQISGRIEEIILEYFAR
ncbi:amino acid ABC transporter substrate-binding protein [Shimia sp. R10_1]|uniref:substrate-binding periplasmic protein n=1 Tax=Shimia sp. R10_1 TaxID=2821095 RepID=UPI001ADB1FE4|nr:transporter substrate-binding domain-containing protein [Shimia sp. R10_1]MBO9474828.1 amino acid ABC transporter substrate-binding protein [Shimia sp. R10_1]